MNSKKLKIGIVGLGEQTTDNLLPVLLLSKYAVVTAICDIDGSKLITVGDNIDIPIKNRHLSYHQMIENEQLDAIIVSSFPEIHYQVAKHAILHGIPVFVEKPPVSELDQLHELIALSKLKSVKTGVGMNFSYTDAHHLIKDIMSEEEFGSISFVSVEHISSKPVSPLWHLDNTIQSFLLAQLIHPLDYILSIGGKVKSLSVHNSKHQIPFIIQVMIEFENGMIGCLKSGSFYPRFKHEIEIISENGSMLKVNDLSTIEVTKKHLKAPFNLKAKQCSTVYTPSPLKSGYTKAGYTKVIDSFLQHILSEQPYSHSFEHMLPVYEAMEQIKYCIAKKEPSGDSKVYSPIPLRNII